MRLSLDLNKIEKIKEDILGKKYSLSVAYVPEAKSREINKKYRKKDRSTNVLSFALRPTEGELVLCKAVIKREAKKMETSFEKWLGFLVIHGMLHLKGYEHSSTMERLETKYDQKYNSGNRRGVHHDSNSSRRIHQRRKKS